MEELTLNHVSELDAIGELIYSKKDSVSCNDIFGLINASESPLLTSFVSENITKETTSKTLKIAYDDRCETGSTHNMAIKILRQLEKENHPAAPDQEDFVFTKCHTDKDGNKLWKWGDKLHRDDKDEEGLTLPAAVLSNGSKFWYKNGERHRDDKDEEGLTLPAEIFSFGLKRWFKNGRDHRDDKDEEGLTLPAVIWYDGRKEWFKNGKRHRDDKDEKGLTLPAEISSTETKRWYKNGKRHRDDKDEKGLTLPAVIWYDGRKEWYKNGRKRRSEQR